MISIKNGNRKTKYIYLKKNLTGDRKMRRKKNQQKIYYIY